MKQATRLQLGASRLESLDHRVLSYFLNSSWIHLGDPPKPPPSFSYYWTIFRKSPHQFVRLLFTRLISFRRPLSMVRTIEELYAMTDFRIFFYQKGDKLPFPDEQFDYIFSEHFLNCLFLDEAYSLLIECRRLLKSHGVIRTVVSDADLRIYEKPEPVGYPDVRLAFTEPNKIKTRYSVYMLSELLNLAGFKPIPLCYCDRTGRYISHDPYKLSDVYTSCPEREFIFSFNHIYRVNSLIVDGIKDVTFSHAVQDKSKYNFLKR